MQKTFFNSKKVRAFFTDRHGGVSKSPFNTFNLGFRVGDEREDVLQNRKILAEKIGTKKIAYMNQVHSDKIEIADKAGEYSKTDALITNQKNLALMVMVADCMPIIYFDPENLVVAVAHAGREGTFLEIASKTLQKMKKEFNTKSDNVLISLGPSIKSCCYEVGEKIAKECENKFGEKYVLKKVENSEEKYFLDLSKLNVDQLLKLGIKRENIEVSKICTCCDANYFSYRREEKTGRFVGVVYLK